MRTLPDEAAADGVAGRLTALPLERGARCWMGATAATADRWVPARAGCGASGTAREPPALEASDSLVKGVAGGRPGGETEAADEAVAGVVVSVALRATDAVGAWAVTDAALTERAEGLGVAAAGGTSAFVGPGIGSPSPGLCVCAGRERTVRPGPAKGDRWAAAPFGVVLGEEATDPGVASDDAGADSASAAAGSRLDAGAGASSSIRPAGAALSAMAER